MIIAHSELAPWLTLATPLWFVFWDGVEYCYARGILVDPAALARRDRRDIRRRALS